MGGVIIYNSSDYNINDLLSSNPYYDKMYELVLKNTQSEKAASTLVLYLESLKQEDLTRIRKYSFLNHDFELQPLISLYKEVNYETLVIERIIPSQAEPSYEVQLSYRLKKGTSKEFRTVHINLYDGVNMDIYEDPDQ
ncbi:hypothetical protein [Psychrobacillus sp. L4]|uniref:hypothetical protein n=1 Tax=Psychrobacillus sp. L4 TaxID=3236892 RepID=UPI0036F218A8